MYAHQLCALNRKIDAVSWLYVGTLLFRYDFNALSE